jgi:hypothetical protein
MASFPFESKQDFLDAVGKKFDERIQGFSNSLTKTPSSNVETTVTQSLSIEEDSNFVLKEISLVMKATYSLMLKSLELQQGAQTETWNQVNDSLEDLLALNQKDRISTTQKAGEEPQAKIVGEDGGDRKLFSAGNLAKGGLLGAIGLLTALPVLSAIWLKSRGKDLPEEFENLVGNIRGSLMGLAIIPTAIAKGATAASNLFKSISFLATRITQITGKFITVPKMLSQPFSRITKTVTGITSKITSLFTNIGKAFNTPIFKQSGQFTGAIARFGQFIGNIIKPLKGLFAIAKPFLALARPLLGFAKAIPVFGQVLTAIFALFDGFSAFFKTLRDGGTLVEAIGSFFIGAIDGFINSIIDLIDLITFGLIPDSIINFFKDPLAKLTKIMSAIVNVITSLPRMVIDGLKSAFPDFVSGIKDVIDNVLGWVKDKINALNPFRKKTEEEKFAEQFDKDTDREARQRFGRRARRGLSRVERAEMDRQEEEFRAQRAQQRDQASDTVQSFQIALNRELEQNANLPKDTRSSGRFMSTIRAVQTAYDAEQARRQGPPVVINNNVVDQSSTVASQANISGGGGRSAPAVNPMVVH